MQYCPVLQVTFPVDFPTKMLSCLVAGSAATHSQELGTPHNYVHSMAKTDVQYCPTLQVNTWSTGCMVFPTKILCCCRLCCYILTWLHTHMAKGGVQYCPVLQVYGSCSFPDSASLLLQALLLHTHKKLGSHQHCPEAQQRQMCSTVLLCKSTPGLWTVQPF